MITRLHHYAAVSIGRQQTSDQPQCDQSMTDLVWTPPIPSRTGRGFHVQEDALTAAAGLACPAVPHTRRPRTRSPSLRHRPDREPTCAAPRRRDRHVVIWVRCKPGINAFELDTTVDQPKFGAFGQDVKVTGFACRATAPASACSSTSHAIPRRVPRQPRGHAPRLRRRDVETDRPSRRPKTRLNVKLVQPLTAGGPLSYGRRTASTSSPSLWSRSTSAAAIGLSSALAVGIRNWTTPG